MEKITDYGTVDHQGRLLTIMQNPYASSDIGTEDYYEALAIDDQENEYLVYWKVLDHEEIPEDESEMCDWEKYEVKKLH